MTRLGALAAACVAPLSRAAAAFGLLAVVALLPWLSRTDPALTVLRARSEIDPTPQALAAVRAQLGLDDGPLALSLRWLGGLLSGDAGTSWVSGAPVLPSINRALGVSVTLMLGALAVTVVVAGVCCARTLRLGGRRRLARRSGSVTVVVAATPKFLLASLLSTVVAVRWGWLPATGWSGPQSMILPSLALGLPSGAMIGGLLDHALPAAFAEPWSRTWAAAGVSAERISAHALRRALPAVLPQLLPTVVALVGGAVAVEKVFAVPGLGQLTLDAAIAQDLPVLRTGALTLIALGVAAGLLVRAARRALLGPALRAGALPPLHRPPLPASRIATAAACAAGILLGAAVLAGLLRDPLQVDVLARLSPPSLAYPLGTDALGRDLLARLGHGALRTVAIAAAVTALSVVAGTLIGLLPRVSAGATEIVSVVPAVLAGLLVTSVTGPSTAGAAFAVCLVGWTPYAAQTSALLEQEMASGHVLATRAMGASPWQIVAGEVLPALVPPLLRNALLRLPTCVLVLASLGFLGLGSQPPAPEWGRLLSENQPYAELAPWTVLGPAAALCLLALLVAAAASRERR